MQDGYTLKNVKERLFESELFSNLEQINLHINVMHFIDILFSNIDRHISNFGFSLKEDGKIMLYTNLLNTNAVEINDMTIGIEFPNGITSFNQKILDDVTNQNEIIKEIFKLTGKQINLRFKDGKVQAKPGGGASSEKPREVKDFGFDINIIE